MVFHILAPLCLVQIAAPVNGAKLPIRGRGYPPLPRASFMGAMEMSDGQNLGGILQGHS